MSFLECPACCNACKQASPRDTSLDTPLSFTEFPPANPHSLPFHSSLPIIPVGSALPPLRAGSNVMGRYRILNDEPLGEGGWCSVWKACHVSSGREVAVKTFRDQTMREAGIEDLEKRFNREIAIFRTLNITFSSGAKTIESAPQTSVAHASQCDPKQLFVNLLDFSSDGDDDLGVDLHKREPGRAADGRYYTVLELADKSLDAWIASRSTNLVVGRAELCEVARALAASLAWLHGCKLCHNDVKPANIMRFGTRWKLIDLEGVIPMNGPAEIHTSCLTPLYVCPELAHGVLEQLGASGNIGIIPSILEGIQPTEKMDVWAAGIVLLDVLAQGCAFEEIYSSFKVQAMMTFDGDEDPTGGLQQWYKWLVDPVPILPGEYASPPELYSGQNLSDPPTDGEFAKIHSLFTGLLAKDPTQRFSTSEFLAHPACSHGDEVAQVSQCELSPMPPVSGKPWDFEDDKEKPTRCRCFSFKWWTNGKAQPGQ